MPVALDLDLADLSIQQLLADQFPGEDLPVVGGLSGPRRAAPSSTGSTASACSPAAAGPTSTSGGPARRGLPIAGDLPITLDRGVISGRDLHLTAPGQDITSSGFTYDLQRGAGQLRLPAGQPRRGPAGAGAPGPPEARRGARLLAPHRGARHGRGDPSSSPRKEYSLRLTPRPPGRGGAGDGGGHGPRLAHPEPAGGGRPAAGADPRGGALMVTGRVPLAAPGRTASEPLALAIDAAQWPAAGLAYLLGPELTRTVPGGALRPRRPRGLPRPADRPRRRHGRGPGGLRRRRWARRGRRSPSTAAGSPSSRGRWRPRPAPSSPTAASIQATRGDEPHRAGAGPRARPPSRSGATWGASSPATMSVEAAASGTLTPAAGDRLRPRPGPRPARPGAPAASRGRRAPSPPGTASGWTSGARSWGSPPSRANGRLDRQGADVAIDLRSDQLGALARALSPQPLPEFTGSLVGTTALAADFGAGTWRALVRLPDLRLQYQGRTIASREPVVVGADSRAGQHPVLLPGRAGHRERADRPAARWA